MADSERASKRVKVEDDDALVEAQRADVKQEKVVDSNGNGNADGEEAKQVLKEEEQAEADVNDNYGIYEYNLQQHGAGDGIPPSGDLYLDTVRTNSCSIAFPEYASA